MTDTTSDISVCQLNIVRRKVSRDKIRDGDKLAHPPC